MVQWDGSSTAVVPPLTRDGRAYVQNMLRAAGISGDYTSAEVQSRLIDWGMFNGQWIGAVEPKSVEGFKNVGDVEQATTAFLKNFERAGTEHHQRRIDAAKRWHNFLSDLPSDFDDFESFETMTNVGSLDFLVLRKEKSSPKDGILALIRQMKPLFLSMQKQMKSLGASKHLSFFDQM